VPRIRATAALIGVAAGLLSGFFGVGGGIIMVPLMLALLHYDQHTAHATSLAAIFVIAVSGAVTFGLSGELDVPLALSLGVGGMVGSTLGAHTLDRVSARTLRIVFAAVLLVAGVRLMLGGDVGAGSGIPVAWGWLVGAAIGVIAGFASGVAGIGGGVVMVPAMVFFLATTQHTAEGTSLLAILFTSLAGTRVNLKNRRVELGSAIAMGLAGALTAPWGAWLALQLEGERLATVFGGFILLTTARMIWQLWRRRVPA
jgi:uncharacterized membrane protein YfcA